MGIDLDEVIIGSVSHQISDVGPDMVALGGRLSHHSTKVKASLRIITMPTVGKGFRSSPKDLDTHMPQR